MTSRPLRVIRRPNPHRPTASASRSQSGHCLRRGHCAPQQPVASSALLYSSGRWPGRSTWSPHSHKRKLGCAKIRAIPYMTILAELTSDDVLDTAYDWLCQPRPLAISPLPPPHLHLPLETVNPGVQHRPRSATEDIAARALLPPFQ